MNNLQILSKEIRQSGNLYLLNDLHKASGGSANDAPNRFTRTAQTKALINEINQTPNMALPLKAVRGTGIYASKQLVIAYGAWISPKLHLAVINAFLDKQEEMTEKLAALPKEGLTPAQQRHIQKRVSVLVHGQVGATFSAIWGGIKDKFNVGTYKDIPPTKYGSLCTFLKFKPLVGELMAEDPFNIENIEYIRGWLAVGMQRQTELQDALKESAKLQKKLEKIASNSFDPVSEPFWHLHQYGKSNVEMQSKKEELIKMQDGIRGH